MNGEKHEYKGMGKPLFRLFSFGGTHDAFEKQFGLLGDLQLVCSGSKDIERMLQLGQK